MLDEKSQEKLIYLHEQIAAFEKIETEHKRKKNATWNETEKKHLNQLENIEGNACIVQDGKIKLINEQLLKLMGYSSTELIDSLFMHFVDLDELPKLAKMYGKRLAGEDVPSIYKTVAKHKDGNDVYIEINSGIIPYKAKAATLVIIRYLHKRE